MLLAHILVRDLDYWNLTRKKIKIGKYIAEDEEMIEKAKGYKYEKVGFILDRGYFSKGNITYLDKSGYNFVIMVRGMKKIVNQLVRWAVVVLCMVMKKTQA